MVPFVDTIQKKYMLNIQLNRDFIKISGISKITGLSRSYVSRLLAGKRKNPEALAKIEKAIEEISKHVSQ